MPIFGTKSSNELGTLHRDIQTILNAAIKLYDFSVIEGQRTAARQAHHWGKGRRLKAPDLDPKVRDNWTVEDPDKIVTTKDGFEKKSIHQKTPVSEAVDLVPYPSMWSNVNRQYELAGVIKAVQAQLLADGKIERTLEWGPDLWNGFDPPHFQLHPLQ